jgi:hypothetical protein
MLVSRARSVHPVSSVFEYWMDRGRAARHRSHMGTLRLEDDELTDAAQAARVASALAEKDAEKYTNASVRALFDSAARRFRELAEKFERARLK